MANEFEVFENSEYAIHIRFLKPGEMAYATINNVETIIMRTAILSVGLKHIIAVDLTTGILQEIDSLPLVRPINKNCYVKLK